MDQWGDVTPQLPRSEKSQKMDADGASDEVTVETQRSDVENTNKRVAHQKNWEQERDITIWLNNCNVVTWKFKTFTT